MKAPANGSFLTVAVTAAVVTSGLLLVTLSPVAGQDAAAKGGAKGAGKGGEGRSQRWRVPASGGPDSQAHGREAGF